MLMVAMVTLMQLNCNKRNNNSGTDNHNNGSGICNNHKNNGDTNHNGGDASMRTNKQL